MRKLQKLEWQMERAVEALAYYTNSVVEGNPTFTVQELSFL